MPPDGDNKVMKDFELRFPSADDERAPPDVLYSRVRARIESERASTTSMRVRVIVAFVIASCSTAGVVLTASDIVYQRWAVGLYFAARSIPYLLLVFCLLIGLTLTATFVAMSRGRRGFGSGLIPLLVVAGLVAPVYAVLVLVGPVHTDGPKVASVVISAWGGRCLVISSLVGGLVLASFTIALRRSAPVASWLRGGALGAAAGAWAGLSTFIFCPSGDLQHLLLGHLLPVVAFTILGFIAIPRALRL
jgi:hypothetical protein